jgi:hypothetical protein
VRDGRGLVGHSLRPFPRRRVPLADVATREQLKRAGQMALVVIRRRVAGVPPLAGDEVRDGDRRIAHRDVVAELVGLDRVAGLHRPERAGRNLHGLIAERVAERLEHLVAERHRHARIEVLQVPREDLEIGDAAGLLVVAARVRNVGVVLDEALPDVFGGRHGGLVGVALDAGVRAPPRPEVVRDLVLDREDHRVDLVVGARRALIQHRDVRDEVRHALSPFRRGAATPARCPIRGRSYSLAFPPASVRERTAPPPAPRAPRGCGPRRRRRHAAGRSASPPPAARSRCAP